MLRSSSLSLSRTRANTLLARQSRAAVVRPCSEDRDDRGLRVHTLLLRLGRSEAGGPALGFVVSFGACKSVR